MTTCRTSWNSWITHSDGNCTFVITLCYQCQNLILLKLFLLKESPGSLTFHFFHGSIRQSLILQAYCWWKLNGNWFPKRFKVQRIFSGTLSVRGIYQLLYLHPLFTANIEKTSSQKYLLDSTSDYYSLTSNGSEKSGRSGTNIPTSAHTTINTVHMPRTTTGQSAISAA